MAKWGEGFVQASAVKGGPTGKLPFMQATGLHTALDLKSVAHGETVFEWVAAPALVSVDGIIQGGALGVVADICQGHTYMSTLEAFHGFSTTDLQIRFLSPIRARDILRITSSVTLGAGQMTLIHTEFSAPGGEVCAAAQGGWRATNRAFAKAV